MPTPRAGARPTAPVTPSVSPTFLQMSASFRRSLLAENKSARTVQTYLEGVGQFGCFLAEHGMPQEITALAREHVEEFITNLLARFKPATANNRYRALQAFFRWAVDEGEIKQSPMAHMRPRTSLRHHLPC